MLRRVYRKRMQVQFNLKAVLLSVLRRQTKTIPEGEKFSFPLHVAGSGGFGYSSVGKLPVAGEQKPGRHYYNHARTYGTIEIDGIHMDSTKSAEGAEVEVYDFETTNLVRQIKHGVSFDLYGDGSGKLAAPVSSAGATSLVVDSVRGIPRNTRIDVLKTADGSVGGGVVNAPVTVNTATKTLSLVAPYALADFADVNANPGNYTVYRANCRNDSIFGLAAAIGTTNPPGRNFGDIDRTVAGNEYWKGQELTNGGVPREPTFDLFEEMIDIISQESDGEVGMILVGFDVYRKLASELQRQRRYESSTKTFNGWIKAIMHNDVPIVRDKHCPPTKAFCLDLNMVEIAESGPGDWKDTDGAILHRVDGYDRYNAFWRHFQQLVCHAPNANGIIHDLATTPVV